MREALIDKYSKEEIENLINKKPFTQIGKMYGVSDNAVRKWCIIYGITCKSKHLAD